MVICGQASLIAKGTEIRLNTESPKFRVRQGMADTWSATPSDSGSLMPGLGLVQQATLHTCCKRPEKDCKLQG